MNVMRKPRGKYRGCLVKFCQPFSFSVILCMSIGNGFRAFLLSNLDLLQTECAKIIAISNYVFYITISAKEKFVQKACKNCRITEKMQFIDSRF